MNIDTNGFEIEDVVRDRVTGFEGKIVGITQWTTGCARASVQPGWDKEKGGKIQDAYSIDCLTLDMVEPGPRHASQPEPELVGATKGGPPTAGPIYGSGPSPDDHYHG